MTWEFNNERPIYLQIVDELIVKIISGEYPAGSKLLPVRELAAQIKVNPNTVQRAFAQLEQLNIIVTQRTNGRFVTDDKQVLADLRSKIAYQHVDDFLSSMQQLGFSDVEVLEYFKIYRKDDK